MSSIAYQNEISDVALLITSAEFVFSEMVQPLCLPAQDVSALSEFQSTRVQQVECIVSGWGRIEEGGTVSDVLRKVAVSIFPHSLCASIYGSKLNQENFCAGDTNLSGTSDSCQVHQGRSQDFISGVEHFKGSASWGRRKNFENFQKFSSENC